MVFVLDRHKQPLMPCTPKRARLLLACGRAVVHRVKPFVIRLRDRRVEDSTLQPLALKIDPGSKATGMALARVQATQAGEAHHAVFLAEVTHRGDQVHQAKQTQRNARRRRRSANLRYRAARFDNRSVPQGWLPPSLLSRIGNVRTWTGGRTRWNRARFGIEKTHALDALCVGQVAAVAAGRLKTLSITATGRGQHCRTNWDKYGFPVGYLMRQKRVGGFQTGDRVRAVVPEPLKTAGTHLGRLRVRKSGSFRVGSVDGIGVAYCQMVQRADGYEYALA